MPKLFFYTWIILRLQSNNPDVLRTFAPQKNKIMILPSQTEDQVLDELDQDHAWIVSRAKKEAKKQILEI